MAKPMMRALVLGVALAALAGCDRVEQLGQLTSDVLNQITGGGQDQQAEAPVDPLASAPVEARAVFGVMQAPVELEPVSLEDMLQTQSFFAVGSVIAMPKTQIVEPVLEPETFDLVAAQPDAAAPTDSSLNTGSAPQPSSADAPAGAPIVEAAPPPPTAAPEENRVAVDGAPRIIKPRSPIKATAPQIKAPSATIMREQAQIAAPKALQEAVRDSGIEVKPEALRSARASAEQTMKATSQTAQSIGDQISRKAQDLTMPIPKPLQVRSRLDVDKAIEVRDKAGRQLEAMGLSGIVTPGEGGQMRITIGVNPTQFREGKIDLSKVNAMRALFAEKKATPAAECSGAPDAAKLRDDPVLATECVVKVLQESGDYEYVEKDYIFTNQMLKKPTQSKPVTALPGAPNDPLFGLQWHFKDNGAAAGQSGGGAGFNGFWTKTKDKGSRDVVVAVVDTGLQMNHPDIKGSPNLAPGYDMVSDPMMGNDGDGRDNDPNDPGDKCDAASTTTFDTFHGTHVAGTIGVASTNNAAGVAGGNWDVTIVPVRALGRCGGKLSDINDAIRWAAGTVPARGAGNTEIWNSNPADIINLSIGLFEPCPASMQAAINDATAAGAIVVAAAGNARVDVKYFAPGGCDNVVSVAANDARGVLTPYSNYGAKVAIMAPGGDMSRDDDKDGRPDGVLSTKFSKNCIDPAKPGTNVAQCYYSYENGTSMAAPHVSAALALLKAKYPSAVPSDLRSKLMQSSMPRTEMQCSGKCSAYPGGTPIAGSPDMCFRPCGGKMLNLANAPAQ
ncbi:MAG TPA: S8 family serine peptidase [Hyphomonadaceae bacterium]|nr:S8 family serine peptidase [Hyphomonadaceae bacterium]